MNEQQLGIKLQEVNSNIKKQEFTSYPLPLNQITQKIFGQFSVKKNYNDNRFCPASFFSKYYIKFIRTYFIKYKKEV